MDYSSGRRRLRRGTGSQREHLYPSISSWAATCTGAAGRRASHMRARRLGKGRALAPTFLPHQQLHNNKNQSHATDKTTPFNRLSVQLIWNFSVYLLADSGDSGQTRCQSSLWRVSPHERGCHRRLSASKLAWAVHCFSWTVAMAPDHTTNGIHSTNSANKRQNPAGAPTRRCGEVQEPLPYLATDRRGPF